MARTDALTAFPSAGAVLADGFPNLTAKETIMPQIGQFTREESRIVGRIETFTLFHDIVIVPADPSDAENAPDYRIHDHDPGVRDIGPEIGAGWKRTGEKAGEYIALVIDDPGLAQPIRANLFQSADDKSAWGLYWNRPTKRSERD